MDTKRHRWLPWAGFMALGVMAIVGTSTPSWARSSYGYRPYDRYDRDYYDYRDYTGRDYHDDKTPYYNPYDRTITIPVPDPKLPPGTEKIIEGVFEMFLQGR